MASALLLMAGLMATPRHLAAQHWQAMDVKDSPPPQHDIDQGRPDLSPSRPESGAINSYGDMTGYGWNGVKNIPDANDPNYTGDPNYGYSYNRPYFYSREAGTIANLGDLAGDFGDGNTPGLNETSRGYNLNDHGWLVGEARDAYGLPKPFCWIDDDGNGARTMTPTDEMRELALNPPDPCDPGSGPAIWGRAFRVTNSGFMLIQGDTGTWRAKFEYDPNTGTLTEVGSRMYVNGGAGYNDSISECGTWIAWGGGSDGGNIWHDFNGNDVVEPNEICHSALFSPTAGSHSPSSTITGVNSRGQVAGYSYNDWGKAVAWFWTDLNGNHQFDWDDTNGNGYLEYTETSDEIQRWMGDGTHIGGASGNTFARAMDEQGRVVGGFAYGLRPSFRNAWIWDAVNGVRYISAQEPNDPRPQPNDPLIDPNFPISLRQAEAVGPSGVIGVYGRVPGTTEERLCLVAPIHRLDVKRVKEEYGTVQTSPSPDPNHADPNDPNAMTYPAGVEVTLTAVPEPDRSWNRWKILDPNYPGDANYAIEDSNTVVTVLMLADREVEAHFKCGSALEPLVPLLVVMMGACTLVRRRKR